MRDKLVDDGDAQVYEEAVDIIKRDYYRNVDRDQLLDKSLGAAVKSLDDQFSNYFSPKDYADFQEVTQGQFSGVGMTVEETKQGLRVMTVYDDSPAAEGGLKPGDVVTAVNGRSIAGASSEASTARIKGPAGTSVTLTVKSGKREREVKLERAQVDIPVVESSMERQGSRKVGHVHLAGFTSGAHGEVSQAVRKLLRQGADGIVLDLRDNGGGLLNEAVLVSSIFIPEGKIVSTKGRSRPERVYEATGGAIPALGPGRRAGQPPVGVGVGDRHGRAAGPQARARSSAPARSARASSRRSSRSPTAARWTSPSASTSCPAGATSAAAGSTRATGSRPTSRPSTTRRPSPTRRWTRPSAWSCATAREAPRARRRAEERLTGGGPVVARARAARALPDGRAVLLPRAPDERRPPARRLGRAARRPRARRPRTGRARATRRSCAGSGARTSPAT